MQASTTVTPTLEDDGKTVTLSLSKKIENETTVAMIVKPIATKADANEKTATYTTSFYFNDTTKPTFVDYTNPSDGIVVLNFSEELDQSTITDSNISVTKDGAAQTIKTTGTPTTGEVLLTKTDDGFKLSGLEKDVDYVVRANGLKDLAGNLSSPNVITQTVKSTFDDTVKPTVTDVSTSGLDKVVVKVDKELKNLASDPSDPAKYVTLDGVTPKATAQDYDKDKGTVTVELDSAQSEGAVKTIKVSGYTDLAGNTGEDFTKNVSFSNVTNVVGSQIVNRNDSGTINEYLKVNFDKDITLAGSGDLSATLTTPDNVVKNITIPYANLEKGSNSETNVLYAKLSGISGLEEGSLEVTLDDAVITTLSEDTDITVIYTPADSNAPKVSGGLDDITAQTVTVNYNKDMGQSALDVNNYTVDGQKVFEKAVFDGDKTKVKLTLKEGSIPVDNGVYDFAISTAVKGDNGVALANKYTEQVTLKANIAPTITKAELQADGKEIKLTFSEAVIVAKDDKQFDVFVGGSTTAEKAEVKTATTNQKTAIVELDTALTAKQLAQTITVKSGSDNTVKDTNGNKLNFSSIEVTK